jgi:DNA polymerase III alpha subunit (gram-positive type)
VNPEEILSPDIIKLTNISQSMVDTASTLQNAYDTMTIDVKTFDVLNMIHQWGVSDSFLLRKQLGENTNWIFGRRWIDTKALSQTYALMHKKKLRGGLKRMAGQLGIQVSSELAHRADYDAEITFLLHCKLAQHFLLK